ncbi:MAG: hemN [Segetibacter sp.]|nr:hemN [Segetibacter sp.]
MNEQNKVDQTLIEKYNQPVARYTSYPTVPFWKETMEVKDWKNIVANKFKIENSKGGISLYIHLPFCESLCTYCGCNKKITTNHGVEEPYIKALEMEWKLYRQLMHEVPVIRELHLGGGTPTFFSDVNLQRILEVFLHDSIVHPMHEFSIEGHPNNTTIEQLQVLYNNGFRRISYGVQDDDPEVQKVINRIQPFENVKRATENARSVGFTSVNFDLIYGLPLQTISSIETTIKKVTGLMPDRIAFYSYAHVPWTSKGQRLFDENDLPCATEKVALYVKGKELLMSKGYTDIGMDHFALPHDELYKARTAGSLHRNFMGYTTQHSGMLFGLGVSSISDVGIGFAQNEKTLHDYYKLINAVTLPIKKGFILSEEDLLFRRHILNISCRGYTKFNDTELATLRQCSFPFLKGLQEDGLVQFNEDDCTVTAVGHYFIRNICSAFDLYLQRIKPAMAKQLFSKGI